MEGLTGAVGAYIPVLLLPDWNGTMGIGPRSLVPVDRGTLDEAVRDAVPLEADLEEEATPLEADLEEEATPLEAGLEEEAAPLETGLEEEAAPLEVGLDEAGALDAFEVEGLAVVAGLEVGFADPEVGLAVPEVGLAVPVADAFVVGFPVLVVFPVVVLGPLMGTGGTEVV